MWQSKRCKKPKHYITRDRTTNSSEDAAFGVCLIELIKNVFFEGRHAAELSAKTPDNW